MSLADEYRCSVYVCIAVAIGLVCPGSEFWSKASLDLSIYGEAVTILKAV